MDPVLANALKKKAKLEKDLAEVERFIAMHRKFSAGVQPTGDDGSAQVEVPRLVVRNNPIRPAVYVGVIERILRRIGRPMTRAEVADAVQGEGYAIPSADPIRYIGTILWRESSKGDKFEVIDGRYWLKNIRVPSTPDEKIKLASPLG